MYNASANAFATRALTNSEMHAPTCGSRKNDGRQVNEKFMEVIGIVEQRQDWDTE